MPLIQLQPQAPSPHRAAGARVDAASRGLGGAVAPLLRTGSRGEDGGSSACDVLIDSVESSLWGLIDAPVDTDPQAPLRDGLGRVRSAALQGALALYPSDATTSEELLFEADMAMYRAKRARAGVALYGDGA